MLDAIRWLPRTMFDLSPPRLPLPDYPVLRPGVYWKPNSAFLDELAAHLRGRRVLEIFSGNGYLAAWLQSRGVDVLPTTRFSGHDAHDQGLYCDVLAMEASEAVERFAAQRDVLLACWPTATEAVLHAVRRWDASKPVIFIGEVTNHDKGLLGGCASDAFFAAIDIGHRFEHYHGNMLEAAFECRLKQAL